MKTHCKRGHEFTSENTRVNGQNRRICLTCQKTVYADKAKEKRKQETERKRQLFGPKKNGAEAIDPIVRFWPKVDVRSKDVCWPWKNSVKGPGYGVFWDGSRLVGAHTFSLSLKLHRPLEIGEVARHTCDFPSCCNPNHLVVGTQLDNIQDTVSRGRHHNQLKTHCPRGHEFDGIVQSKKGVRRYCKQCKSESYRRNKLQVLEESLKPY